MASTLAEKRSEALAELPEWQKLLEHFELSDDSFAYIPLLVSDNSWAQVCEKSLTEHLSAKKKKLRILAFTNPEDFKNLASRLLSLKLTKKTAAIWITAPIVFRESQLEIWQEAWREATARLNQYRNPLREKFPVTIIFVGGFDSQEITRTMAPDLWSIRTTVVRIEPPVVVLEGESSITVRGEKNVVVGGDIRNSQIIAENDPYFALQEAEKLGGKKGAEETLIEILRRAVIGFLDRGKYREAVTVSEEIEAVIQTLFEQKRTPELEMTYARTLTEKGIALDDLGEYEEAIRLHKQAIEIDEKTIGKEHSAYATHLNNLALAYEAQGEYDEAIKLFKQVIEIDEKTIGKEHLSYATHLNNLALVYESQGRYDEAIELHKQAIEIDEKTIGKEHSGYATRLNNLALVYKSQGRYDEAIELHKQAIEIDEKTIGKEHPDYAIDLSNLGHVYELLRDSKQALELHEQALKIFEDRLGKDHPYTIIDRENVERCRRALEDGKAE